MRLHFTRNKSLLSRAIRWWTHSEWSHVAIQSGEVIYEATLYGFRQAHYLDWNSRLSKDTVVETLVVEVPQSSQASRWLQEAVGVRYDFLGFLAYMIPWIKEVPRAYYCSEAARKALEEAGVPIPDEPMHPGALRLYLLGYITSSNFKSPDTSFQTK